MLISRIAKNAAARYRAQVAQGDPVEISDSQGGPWASASLEAVVAEIGKRWQANDPEPTLLFVKKGDTVFQVDSVRATHGDDAVSAYEVMAVAPEGGHSGGYLEQGDDISAMLSEAA